MDDDELIEIKDLDNLAEQMRRQSVKIFNDRYSKEGIGLGRKEIFKYPKKLSKKTLEKIIKISLVHEILKRILPYNKETEYYSVNIELSLKCVDAIVKNIFYNVANSLVDAGIYEMVFDIEMNDFAWRVTEKYKKLFEKEKLKDHDETTREEPPNP